MSPMSPDDAALRALQSAWQQLPGCDADAVLFLGAQPAPFWPEAATPQWRRVQPFRPWAEALSAQGFEVQPECPQPLRAARVLVLAPRQRQWARALMAQAVRAAVPGGVVLAAAGNQAGGRSLADDLAALAGPVQGLARHHARAVWTAAPADARIDAGLLQAWCALDAPAPNRAGYISRAGLFAAEAVDAGSALLAAVLPADLRGEVADLGAGWGYLACAALARSPGITGMDLYEADARALEPARANLARVRPDLRPGLHWHDVARGLPRRYDAIVCNPPFHAGRDGRPALGQAFIDAAAGGLHAHGQLWLVANRHLPYEATLHRRFGQVRPVRETRGFKVFRAAEPRA